MTTGYLFKDKREEGAPFVLFMEGFEEDPDDPDATKTIEIRFHDFDEMLDTLKSVRSELGAFEVEFGEPEHFERVRKD